MNGDLLGKRIFARTQNFLATAETTAVLPAHQAGCAEGSASYQLAP
jgi:hypothetical protein